MGPERPYLAPGIPAVGAGAAPEKPAVVTGPQRHESTSSVVSPPGDRDRGERVDADRGSERRADAAGDASHEGQEQRGDSSAGRGGADASQQAAWYAAEASKAYEKVLQLCSESLAGYREQLEQIETQITIIKAEIAETLHAGTGQSPGRALNLMEDHKDLEADVEATTEGEDETLRRTIKTWLIKAGLRLWGMIRRLLKVKEWSLSGEVGSPVFGFAKATISITFG